MTKTCKKCKALSIQSGFCREHWNEYVRERRKIKNAQKRANQEIIDLSTIGDVSNLSHEKSIAILASFLRTSAESSLVPGALDHVNKCDLTEVYAYLWTICKQYPLTEEK